MLTDPTTGARHFQGNRLPQGVHRIIRHAFDASIALACVTILGFALCSPL